MALAVVAACTPLHSRLLTPPRPDAREQARADLLLKAVDGRRIDVPAGAGPGLSFLVVEPRDYGMDWRFKDHGAGFSFSLEFGKPGPVQAARGTVLLLHGWSLDGSWMLPWAAALAEHGYRAVAPDLRSHGRSGDAPVGYGVREAEDLSAVLAQLQADGLATPPLHLFGVSMGAATAIRAASLDDAPWASVVAVAPYRNAAEGIASGVAGLLAQPPSTMSGRMTRGALRARYDADAIEQAIDRASTALGLDLRAVDVGAWLAQVPVCVLHLHGAVDSLIPVATARELSTLGSRVTYVELPDDGHFSVQARGGWLAEPIADWMAAAAGLQAPAPCPSLSLPPDPAVRVPDRS